MKFVKENMTLLICGLIVVLSVASFFYPMAGLVAALQDRMSNDLNVKSNVNTVMNTDLSLPGVETRKGPPSQYYVDAKKESIANINRAQKQVEGGRSVNWKGRLTNNGVPILPVATTEDPAVAWGKPEPGYLPKLTGAAMQFKADYRTQFPLLLSLLATGSMPPASREISPMEYTAPRDQEVKTQFTEMMNKRLAVAQPTGTGFNPVPPPGPAMGMGVSDKEEMDFRRRAVLTRANELRMYVEPGALQVRAWAAPESVDAPTEQQIFEAFIDSWYQSDVVRAIMSVNNSVVKPKEKNIAKMPVKRLMRIVVGNNARTRVLGTPLAQASMSLVSSAPDPGPLFFTPQSATSGGSVSVPVTGAVDAGAPLGPPNQINYDLSMTGHASGADYDVVLMSIWMDIDPQYLNAFVDQLYRQNMGYAVISLQTKTVNPLDRVSNGYLYGDGQVVEVEMLVEGIIFRGTLTPPTGVAPLIPDAEKPLMGIPVPPTPQ